MHGGGTVSVSNADIIVNSKDESAVGGDGTGSVVKVVNGIAGTMAGVGREAEASMREKMREWVGGMDFVSRAMQSNCR